MTRLASPITISAGSALSLGLPTDNHPNKLPFSGVLTRLDEASDGAPFGSAGKRIRVTRAAGQKGLGSLLGMAIGLKADFSGHAPRNKVALITGAHIAGNAINIEGFIYAADFPDTARQIRERQADLGFSFEARDLDVEDINANPLVVTSCIFTGAAIMLKQSAAYTLTSLAAANERDIMAAAHDLARELRSAAEYLAGEIRINTRQLRLIRR